MTISAFVPEKPKLLTPCTVSCSVLEISVELLLAAEQTAGAGIREAWNGVWPVAPPSRGGAGKQGRD